MNTDTLEKMCYLSILIGSLLGLFLGYWDELSWFIPLYQDSLMAFILIGFLISISGGSLYVFKKIQNQ